MGGSARLVHCVHNATAPKEAIAGSYHGPKGMIETACLANKEENDETVITRLTRALASTNGWITSN